MALILLTIAIIFRLRENQEIKKRTVIFFFVAMAQGGIGFIQFHQGFPELLVGAHLLGVTLVWIGAWRMHLSVNR